MVFTPPVYQIIFGAACKLSCFSLRSFYLAIVPNLLIASLLLSSFSATCDSCHSVRWSDILIFDEAAANERLTDNAQNAISSDRFPENINHKCLLRLSVTVSLFLSVYMKISHFMHDLVHLAIIS